MNPIRQNVAAELDRIAQGILEGVHGRLPSITVASLGFSRTPQFQFEIARRIEAATAAKATPLTWREVTADMADAPLAHCWALTVAADAPALGELLDDRNAVRGGRLFFVGFEGELLVRRLATAEMVEERRDKEAIAQRTEQELAVSFEVETAEFLRRAAAKLERTAMATTNPLDAASAMQHLKHRPDIHHIVAAAIALGKRLDIVIEDD